jgi:hypothetical protein
MTNTEIVSKTVAAIESFCVVIKTRNHRGKGNELVFGSRLTLRLLAG